MAVPHFRAMSKLTSHHRHFHSFVADVKSDFGRKDLASKTTVVIKSMESVIHHIEFPGVSDVGCIVQRLSRLGPAPTMKRILSKKVPLDSVSL